MSGPEPEEKDDRLEWEQLACLTIGFIGCITFAEGFMKGAILFAAIRFTSSVKDRPWIPFLPPKKDNPKNAEE